MGKLRLDIDALAVDGFSTTGWISQPRGTVRAHTGALCVEGDQSWDGACGGNGDTCSCSPNTCFDTCFETCDNTCNCPYTDPRWWSCSTCPVKTCPQ